MCIRMTERYRGEMVAENRSQRKLTARKIGRISSNDHLIYREESFSSASLFSMEM